MAGSSVPNFYWTTLDHQLNLSHGNDHYFLKFSYTLFRPIIQAFLNRSRAEAEKEKKVERAGRQAQGRWQHHGRIEVLGNLLLFRLTSSTLSHHAMAEIGKCTVPRRHCAAAGTHWHYCTVSSSSRNRRPYESEHGDCADAHCLKIVKKFHKSQQITWFYVYAFSICRNEFLSTLLIHKNLCFSSCTNFCMKSFCSNVRHLTLPLLLVFVPKSEIIGRQRHPY